MRRYRRGRALLRTFAVGLLFAANVLVPARAFAEGDPPGDGPACQAVLSIFARGSQDETKWNPPENAEFERGLQSNLPNLSYLNLELGDLNNNDRLDNNGYPALKGWGWAFPGYAASVNVGAVELTNFLSARNCPHEAIVLGGYSQGADVIGLALEWGLPAAVKDRIAYVALYGDPRFYNGSLMNCFAPSRYPWVMQGDGCMRWGPYSAPPSRIPYLPSDFVYKTGSWCADGDEVCRGNLVGGALNLGTHETAYKQRWIGESIGLIALMARAKHNMLAGNQTWSAPNLHRGPVPDAMIVQSTEGHLYVAAGGRLFWFDKNNAGMLAAFRNQMQQRYGSTAYPVMDAADVHAVEVNR
ncbi:MAG TPA: cutinase family protein, partial [Candidatus Saccharimonadales bacterium]|nr:cutinase family protein [Candidatus Saccharimonadales bacterium]